jgi:hypothetical protein
MTASYSKIKEENPENAFHFRNDQGILLNIKSPENVAIQEKILENLVMLSTTEEAKFKKFALEYIPVYFKNQMKEFRVS